MLEFFNAFGVDLFKLGAQVVNFVVVLYLLNRFAFRPLIARMDERSARIARGLEDAEAAARDRELARAEREEALAEARSEGEAMLQRATRTAEATGADIVAQARAVADQAASRARDEINAEKERALAELRTQVADLALEAAGKLVQREMDSPTQRRMVEQFLAEERN